MNYRVKHGDSLWSIAETHLGDGQRWTDIAKLNHLVTPYVILVEQHLHLPDDRSPAITPAIKMHLGVMPHHAPDRSNEAHSLAHKKTHMVPARGLFFVLADEINPFAKKLVRKVIVPDHDQPLLIERLTHPERFGFSPREPGSPVSLGRHVLGRVDSKFISASERPLGSPRLPGKRYFIDVAKVEQSGATIHDGAAIAKDLDRIAAKSKKGEFREYIEMIKKKSLEVDREAVIEGEIPAAAVKSAGSMAVTRSLQLVEGVGIVMSVWDLEKATNRSVETHSAAPIERETMRQAGGWAGALGGRVLVKSGVTLATRWAAAMADAEIGGEAGAALGIETGPGAIVTGLVGGLIGGIVGFVAADALSDLLVGKDNGKK
jgi:hypothetical protein